MKFRTEIKNIDIPLSITHKHKLFLIGSCFSDNISSKLNYFKFDTLSNPFGVLYNPLSINKIINNSIENRYPHNSSFVKRDDLWHNFDYHSDMSGEYLDEVSRRIKIISDATKDYLSSCDYLFITYGTAIVHKRNDTGETVANNHKFPADFFTKTRLNIEDITESTEDTINKIKEINPKAKIVFTISPVRHIRDGLVENQRSKAILQLAVEKLIDNKITFYFPSYELLLDDLRDYRYYAKDLVHPSESAIEYIWEKFSDTFFDNSTIQLNTEIEKINKSIDHRPFNENSNSYKDFIKKLDQRINQFHKDNPDISPLFNSKLL